MNNPRRSYSVWWFVGVALFVLTAMLSSCRPHDVLSASQMQEVLCDLHRTDLQIQILGYARDHNQEMDACYRSVLTRHHVSQAAFDSSLVWYTDHPQIFNKIYPHVLARLEREKHMWSVMAQAQHEALMREEQESDRRQALQQAIASWCGLEEWIKSEKKYKNICVYRKNVVPLHGFSVYVEKQ